MEETNDQTDEEREDGERRLIFVRHGIAEPKGGKEDADRALTRQGHARMKEISKGLAAVVPKVDAIYTSPFVRAMQTALWVGKAYKDKAAIRTTDGLLPDAGAGDLEGLLREVDDGTIVLVGHEPNFSSNLRHLLRAGRDADLELRKGGACALRVAADGSTRLEWWLTPKLLRRLR